MAEEQDIATTEEEGQGQTPEGGPQPPDKVGQYYDYLKKAGADVAPSLDSFKKTLSNDSSARQYYDYLRKNKFDAPPNYGSFARTLGIEAAPAAPSVPEHQVTHTPVHDVRHLNELANQPVRSTTTTLDPMSGSSTTDLNQEDVARNKAYRQQYEKGIGDLSAQWGVDPKAAKRAIEDFPDEQDETKLKGFAGLSQQNPVYYGRLKDANDIRVAIAKSGPDGINDANIFNHLQQSDNYENLQHNIALQQEIMTKHGLGQPFFEKLKQSQAPLVNTLDPGLLTQYWNSDDKKLGLSDFQYAGLETEKLFNPDKYRQDVAIIRQNRGLDKPGGTPVPQGKEGYAYDRGVENVLYALEHQGRQNTAGFISQRSAELGPQIDAARQKYQDWIKSTNDAAMQQYFQREFLNDPMLKEAAKLDEGQQSLEYARTEDQRRFPLNYGDQASRTVKDALSQTTGIMGSAGVAGRQVLLGAGETSDNTLRFIKNTFINLLGSDQLQAKNAARNIGHQALTELSGYEGSAFSMQQSPILVDNELVKNIQSTFDDGSLSTEEKNKKALDLIMNHEDQIKVNPAAGQQNLTGKAILYSASNTVGQILGIADQSLLMGGLIGDVSKAQQMASALVPMYASTQNQLYEQALARGEEKPLLRSHIDAAIISLASLINPDIKIVKGMVGAETGLGKLIAGVDEAGWNKVLSTNKPLVDRMVAGTKATAKQLGLAGLQYGLVVPTAQYVVHKNVFNEEPNLGDAIKDGLLQTSITMALPALFHGVWGGIKATQVNPAQKYALVEAGLHPKENIELIDQLVQRGQLTPDRADQIKDVIKQTDQLLEHTEGVKSDGSYMNETEVANLTYQLLRKKVLEGKLKNAPDPEKPAIEAKLHEINQDIADMHTSEGDKHKTELSKLLTDQLDRIREKEPGMEGKIREAIKRNEPEEIFSEIHKRASETKKSEGEEVSLRPEVEETFGKGLVDKAFELHKKPTPEPAAKPEGQPTPEKPPEGAAPPTTTEPVSAASSFLQSRHADTIHDEQGIVSGPNNKELSPQGKRDANDLARDVEGKGVTKVITSGLERSKETGNTVAKKIGAEVEHRPELDTWNIKDFDGLKDDEFKGVQEWFVENPDATIYQGPLEKYRGKEVGESVNEYADRIIPAMERIQKESGPETLLINHSNNMMLWDAYEKNGRKWNEQARQDYLNAEKPEPATLTNQPKEHAIQESGAGSVLQHPQEGAGGQGSERRGVEPGEQGNAPAGEAGGEGSGEGQEPPGGTGGQKVAAGEGPANTVGIHHDALTDLAQRLGLKEPERGTVLTPAEYAARGRILLLGGADPEKIARKFQRTGDVSEDMISVARAHLEDLVREVNRAGDAGDQDALAKAKEAVQRWQDEVVKPMGTKGGKIFTSLQGERDIDHGSFTSVRMAAEAQKGKPLTEKQTEAARDLSGKVKELSGQVKDLQDKLSQAMDKSAGVPGPKEKRSYTSKAKKAADAFRKLKQASFNFKDENGNDIPIQTAGITFNDLIELGAKAIEKSGELADGLATILDKVKDLDWYKGLSDGDKDRFAQELTDHYASVADKKAAARIRALEKQLSELEAGNVRNKGKERMPTQREQELQDQIYDQKVKMGLIRPKAVPQPGIQIPEQPITEKFAWKKDKEFSAEDAKTIWDYVKKTYLDKDIAFGDALGNTATDLGLNFKQVLAALATPKGGRELTLEMWKKNREQRKVLQYAQRFVDTADQSARKKFWNALPSAFFNLKTYGHGTVGNITHAGPNLFRPSVWKAYWPNVFKSFSLAYGSHGGYEEAVNELRQRPNFDAWTQAGLAVDPFQAYDDYQIFGRADKKTALGKATRYLSEAGTKGFTGLKFMRYDLAETFYNRASEAERADPAFREHIAELVNHATGHSEVKVPKAVKVVTFAPGLEISRWQRMITDPYAATKTFLNWKEATPAEQAAAKVVLRGSAERLATYTALLAANAGLLAAAGSKQTLNLTNPQQSDWLKFKMGGKTLDVSGGVLGPIRLLSTIGAGAVTSVTGLPKGQRTTPGEKDERTIGQQLRYKASPIAATALDITTGQDAMGNVMPWSQLKPGKGKIKYTWAEFGTEQLPIPFAAGFKDAYESMRERGVSEVDADAIVGGLVQFGVEGFTGAKLQPDFELQMEKEQKTGPRSRR